MRSVSLRVLAAAFLLAAAAFAQDPVPFDPSREASDVGTVAGVAVHVQCFSPGLLG